MSYTVTWVEVPDDEEEKGPADIHVVQVLQFDVSDPRRAVSEMMKGVDGAEFSQYTTRFIAVEDMQIVEAGRTTKKHKIYKPIPPKPTWTPEEIKQ